MAGPKERSIALVACALAVVGAPLLEASAILETRPYDTVHEEAIGPPNVSRCRTRPETCLDTTVGTIHLRYTFGVPSEPLPIRIDVVDNAVPRVAFAVQVGPYVQWCVASCLFWTFPGYQYLDVVFDPTVLPAAAFTQSALGAGVPAATTGTITLSIE